MWQTFKIYQDLQKKKKKNSSQLSPSGKPLPFLRGKALSTTS